MLSNKPIEESLLSFTQKELSVICYLSNLATTTSKQASESAGERIAMVNRQEQVSPSWLQRPGDYDGEVPGASFTALTSKRGYLNSDLGLAHSHGEPPGASFTKLT